MVKGANPKTEAEWDDHYQTVTEALKRYGSSYRRKMDHDFWRIEQTMTPEERKDRVLEYWCAGDIVPQNPFLHRNLWDRKNDYQSVGWNRRKLDGYDPNDDGEVILIDLCEEEHNE